MKLHRYLAPVALALLSACASEYTEAESPKDLRLDNATTHVDLRFAPGSTRLTARDATRLRALVATGGLQPSDRVLVATGGSPGLAQARFEAIANELAPYRIVATPQPVAVAPNQAIVESVRYLVTLPPCPNWSKAAAARLHQHACQQFRLRQCGQSRANGGESRRSGGRPTARRC